MASCSITGIVSPQSMTKKSYIVLFTVWCSEGYPYLHDFTALLPALFLIGLYLKKQIYLDLIQIIHYLSEGGTSVLCINHLAC